MNDFVKRLFSGIVYISLFVWATMYGKETYFGLIIILGIITLLEFKKIILLKSFLPIIIFPVSAYLFIKHPESEALFYLLLLVLIAFIRLLMHLFSKKNKEYPTVFLEKIDLSIRYIVFPLSFLLILPFLENNYQPNIVISILILTWVSDTFAYLTGIKFGKTKFFERISPKKTLEGFLGGFFFTIVAGAFIGYYFSHFFSVINWVIIALITSVFGTLGDLVESKFKRQANLKDSGAIMPGHGGILDRLDSLIFITPFLYLYIHYLI